MMGMMGEERERGGWSATVGVTIMKAVRYCRAGTELKSIVRQMMIMTITTKMIVMLVMVKVNVNVAYTIQAPVTEQAVTVVQYRQKRENQ